MDKVEILSVLKQDYNFCMERGYELLGLFLFGSQNYNADGPNSDIDVKAIFITEVEEEVPFSYEREAPEGHIDMISVKEFLKALHTGYHTWYELLFTEYCVINPKYRSLWAKIQRLREQFVHEQIVRHFQVELEYLKG
jgi:predicted nucleotidyltransferase